MPPQTELHEPPQTELHEPRQSKAYSNVLTCKNSEDDEHSKITSSVVLDL